MSGEKLREIYPDFCDKHNIKDEDVVYLVGDTIKVLRKYGKE